MLRSRAFRRLGILLLVLLVPLAAPITSGAERIPRREIKDLRVSGLIPPLNPAGNPGVGTDDRLRCTTSGNPAADIDISCDDPIAPDNELAIVTDPEDPDHLLAGSNDYQIAFVGNSAVARIPAGFFVSFDGGKTWTDGQIPLGNAAFGAGDPAPAFNAKFDTAHMASLGFVCGQGGPVCTRGNIQVSTSYDGGLTWQRPVTVAKGHGSDNAAQQIFNDKEWLAADNNTDSPYYGRLYLVWAQYRIEKRFYDESPIYLSYSDDAGRTWSEPRAISGRNPQFCTFQSDQDDVAAGEDPFECDESTFAVPAIASDGTVYVHFHNDQNQAAWEPGDFFENQIMVVKSTDGGASWSNPVHVVQMEDGSRDYPLNVDGRQTLTGHQMRVNPAGNIDVDTSGGSHNGRLFIVFADNADGLHDADTPVTDVNIFLAYSDDGGVTWVGGDGGQTNTATRVRVDASSSSDQWFPWAAVSPADGALKVLYMDGRTDRDLYDITIASSASGIPPFSHSVVSQAPSNPDLSAWFVAGAPDCPLCTTFLGDYNGLAVDTLGRAHGVWTDMRRPITTSGLRTQDAFYARR